MSTHELIGYLASLLVLATFCMSGMVALRAVAIASNVAFIAYAALVCISPVLLLHALLLPMNAYRLLQAMREQRRDRAEIRVLAADLALPVRARACARAGACARHRVCRSSDRPVLIACADRRSDRRVSR